MSSLRKAQSPHLVTWIALMRKEGKTGYRYSIDDGTIYEQQYV